MIDIRAFPSPCFILDEEKLCANLVQLRGISRKCGLQILLALKGFACWSVFPLLRRYLQGAAAGSLYEARLAYEEMGCKAHVYAPAYLPEQVEALLSYAERISFNSLAEHARYGEQARKAGLECGLRVRASYSAAPAPIYDPGAPESRFGVPAASLSNLPEGIDGLHIHALCEADSHHFSHLLKALEAEFGHLFPHLRWLNLGGGHLFTADHYDLAHFEACIDGFKSRYPHLLLIFEPSSAIAWEAGLLKSRVLDVVGDRGSQTALLDVSFTCHMPDCLEMPYRPKVQRAVLDESLPYTYRLGGASCLAGDFLEGYSFAKPLAAGDTLVFEDMLHYSMVKTTHFNGLAHPALGISHTDREKGTRIVRRFGYEDYKTKLS